MMSDLDTVRQTVRRLLDDPRFAGLSGSAQLLPALIRHVAEQARASGLNVPAEEVEQLIAEFLGGRPTITPLSPGGRGVGGEGAVREDHEVILGRTLSGRPTITPLSPGGRGVGGEGAVREDHEVILGRTLSGTGLAAEPPAPAARSVSPGESSMEPMPAGAQGEGSPPRPAPLLRIDWGKGLRLGANLTPRFHLVCPGFHSQPTVTLPRDPRLQGEGWKEYPDLRAEQESQWFFDEPLRLTEEGDYRLELRAVFEEGAAAPLCFRGEIGLMVAAAAAAGGGRLEIEADDAGVVDLPCQDVSGFRNVVVRVKGQGLTRIRGTGAAPQPDRREADPSVTELPLSTDLDLERKMPHLAPGAAFQDSQLTDAAMLVGPGGRRIVLLALRRVLFGRHSDANVVLRLEPLDDARAFLSQRVSREHFYLELRPDGLQIDDVSALGTFLGESLLHHQAHLFSPADLRTPCRVDVAGILSLEMTAHPDPTWAPWQRCDDLIERQYCRVIGASTSQAWEYAQLTRLDAVRVRRLRRLPLRQRLDFLTQALARQPQLAEQAKRLAHSMELVDKLSGREEYVLVFRTATIGGAETDAIWFRGAGLSAAHARLMHFDGRFWLEHLDPRRPTEVNGQRLEPYHLLPLSPGAQLRFGSVEVTFDKPERTVPKAE